MPAKPKPAKSRQPAAKSPEPILRFDSQKDWEKWLVKNHQSAGSVWLKLAKKGAPYTSVTYAEALDVALCYGWIDSQKKGFDDSAWLQRFGPRGPKSIWSKINREKIAVLEKAGKLKPAGIAAVEAAKADGRWAAAYDSQKNATVPEDFQAALAKNPKANTFFESLSSANRYALLFRLHHVKQAENRAKKIAAFLAMLEQKETVHLM